MTLPTPLRMARAIALFQGWAAGIGVFVMLGVAVLAAGGLKNGAFVALALLFLAGDVLAVSVAVVIAARRLVEGAAWARLLLDVVEGVTVAVGLLAILMGSTVLGFFGAVLGVTVILCLHVPSSNAVFAGQPLLPWEAARPEPQAPAFPVPSLPPRRRSGTARSMTATPAPPPVPSARRPVTPPAWQPSAAPGTRRYSWERSPTPLVPPARVPRPADLPSAADRSTPPIEPLPPVAPAAAQPPVMAPPVVPPPDEPPARPFVVPPLEKLVEVPRHATPPPPDPSEVSGARPFVVPSAESPPAASGEETAAAPPETGPAPPAPAAAEPPAPAPAPAEPPAAAVPHAVAAVTPNPPAPPTPAGLWEPRQLPPPAAGASAPPAAPRRGSATVYERRSRASVRPARPARPGMPPAPSWAWRKVVIAASLLGAVGGGTLSAIELIAGGGGRLPATGQAPAPQPPKSGVLPGLILPAPPRPRTERSEPAAAGGVSAVAATPEGACAAGSSCTVTVRVDLEPHPDELVAWTLVVVDRCSSQRVETTVTGVPAPASYRYVLSTNQVTVPAWRSPQIIAVTTSPARASSQPVAVGGASGC